MADKQDVLKLLLNLSKKENELPMSIQRIAKTPAPVIKKDMLKDALAEDKFQKEAEIAQERNVGNIVNSAPAPPPPIPDQVPMATPPVMPPQQGGAAFSQGNENPANNVAPIQSQPNPVVAPYKQQQDPHGGLKMWQALLLGATAHEGQSGGELVNNAIASRRHQQMLADFSHPDSHESQLYQNLGKRLGIPKVDGKSALELQPMIDPYMKLGTLEAKIMAAAARRTGNPRLKPLGEKQEETLTGVDNTIAATNDILSQITQGKTGIVPGALGNITRYISPDPDFLDLKQKLDMLSKAYTKSMEGAKPSDYDAKSYKKIVGGEYDSPEALAKLVKNLEISAKKHGANLVENAKRNGKNTVNFDNRYINYPSSPPDPAQPQEPASNGLEDNPAWNSWSQEKREKYLKYKGIKK